jgi:hypothetical protein
MDLFNTLFSPEKRDEITRPYRMGLSLWDEKTHPLYREPYEEDELSLWTRDTDGIEILHSTLLPCYPTHFTRLHIYTVKLHHQGLGGAGD